MGVKNSCFKLFVQFRTYNISNMRDRGSAPRLKKSQNKGFLSNTGPDPLKNHKATKPAFNVWPSSARQRNAFKWRFAGGQMMASLPCYLDLISPHNPPPPPKKKKKKKKKSVRVGPPLAKLSGSA